MIPASESHFFNQSNFKLYLYSPENSKNFTLTIKNVSKHPVQSKIPANFQENVIESPLGDLGIRGRAATLELNSKDCRAVCGAMFSL